MIYPRLKLNSERDNIKDLLAVINLMHYVLKEWFVNDFIVIIFAINTRLLTSKINAITWIMLEIG